MSQNDPAGLAYAKKLIKECLETQATFLDLGNCGLKDLSELPELWDCQHLEGLYMGSQFWNGKEYIKSINTFEVNKIGDEGARVIAENLKSLTSLDLWSNQIGDEGAKVIAENLKSLTSLDLGNNQITYEGAKYIAENLKSLTSLDLKGNKIGYHGANVIAENLTSLTLLDLKSNKIGNEGAKVIAENLKSLTSLNLGDNKIVFKGAKVIAENLAYLTSLGLGSNKITDEGAKVIAENLTSLTSLSLSSNQIGDEGAKVIAENLKSLSSLDLGSNEIEEEGALAIAENLTSLTSLDLGANLIGDEGAKAIIQKFQFIKRLNIAKNRIKSFTPFLHILQSNYEIELKNDYSNISSGINVSGNKFVEPPQEIVYQGKEAILEYYKQKELTGSKPLLEAKLVLLGDGRAGKTSLACRLLKKELPTEADRTKGVDIVIGEYKYPVTQGEFKLHIWDFAGQDKYKPLHQFFYSESSLYVFVADSGNTSTNFADWFETAELYGEGSPLIVVMNEFDDGMGMGTFDEISWRKQFPTLIQKVQLVNLLSQKGFADIEKDIQHFASQLPHTKHLFPNNWANIRTELELHRNKNYIPIQEYIQICRDNNLPETESALILSSVLHKIGVCLHYQKSELLKQHVILKNEWATTAVYKVLEDHVIANEKRGFFDLKDLKRIWSEDGYQDMIPQLLQLMCEFKLAYPLPNNQEYITPPLLPLVPPEDWKSIYGSSVLVLVEYVFLPKALMTQFITSRHLDIGKGRKLVWRDGVVLRWPSDTVAEIRKIKSQGRDAFQIVVKGIEQKGLLTSILKTLRDLHLEYKGIQVFEFVPCTCEGCISEKNKQHYFDFSYLTRGFEKGHRSVVCGQSWLDVDIMGLLGNLVYFQDSKRSGRLELISDTPKPTKTRDIKIFLASSSELAEDRNEFDRYFRQQNDHLKEKGIYLKIVRWENFLDAMSETRLQNEYNKAVRDCDIFVSLFFTKTGKYTEEEFDVAHQQFMDSGGVKPKIFTFFKKGDVKIENLNQDDVNTLFNFKKKLDALGHYHTQYDNLADLKLQFRDQLDRLIREIKI
jgi:small GTP-binding protein